MVIPYWKLPDTELHVRTFPTSSTLPGFGSINLLLIGLIRTSPFILPLVKIVPLSDHTTSVGHGGSGVVKQHRKQKGLLNGTGYDWGPKKLRTLALEGHCWPCTLPTIQRETEQYSR